MENYELFRFEWPVHNAGYSIQSAEATPRLSDMGKPPKQGEEVVPGVVVANGDEVDIYNPLSDHSGLFQDFANVELSEEGVLEFANQYGLLFDGPTRLDFWYSSIRSMRSVIDAWQSKKIGPKMLHLIEPAMNLTPHFDLETLHLHLWPADLISALWVQLALAISGNKTYRQCEWCGTAFEITPRIARTNRVFCSNACKQKDYRDRQREKP